MICEPTATRKGKHPNGPGRPRIHPTRGTLACRSAGADAATANPRAPAAAAHTAAVPGGCPQGAIAAEGLQIAMPVRPRPGCPAVPACTADAGLREQDRAEMVKCIGLCLDRTDNCTATTLGVVSPQTEYDAAVTRPRLEACVATCKSRGDECERHSRQRAFGR
jgi:hypothetical protein